MLLLNVIKNVCDCNIKEGQSDEDFSHLNISQDSTAVYISNVQNDNMNIVPIVNYIVDSVNNNIIYRLSVKISGAGWTNPVNLYAIYGDREHQATFPSIQQQPVSILNSNIGGINLDIIEAVMDTEDGVNLYDSWLTIGITDGNSNNDLNSIGIDFENWETNDLKFSNGVVFYMDPFSGSSLHSENEVVIAQLILPDNHADKVARVNMQGKHGPDTWNALGVTFNIRKPPE